MTLNFKSIRLTRNDVVITMNPVMFYIVTNHVVKYVILYEILFRKVASEGVEGVELKTTIPYYVSNGITNKLRANLLYPFMCYSNMSDADVCPFNVNVEGNPFSPVLIKYNVVESIDINVVERKLLENFESLKTDNADFEASFVGQLTNIIKEQSYRNDLVSVLKRLTNLVDFIICISCDSVQKFKPTPDEITAVKNGKYCSLLRTNPTDYTDLSIPGDRETYFVSGEKGPTDNTRSLFNAYFRVAIMTTLKSYYDLFVGEGGLDVTDVPALPTNEVTVTELNAVLNVCNKGITQPNMESYKRISIEMMKLFEGFGPGLIRSSVFVHETYQQMYDRLLPGYLCISISPESKIITSDVSKLGEQQILSELKLYSDFMKSQTITVTDKTGKSVSTTLKQGVDAFIEKTCPLEGHEKIKRLRNTLIDIRLRMMKDMYRTPKPAMVTGRGGGRRISRRRRTRKNKTKKSKKLKSKNKIM